MRLLFTALVASASLLITAPLSAQEAQAQVQVQVSIAAPAVEVDADAAIPPPPQQSSAPILVVAPEPLPPPPVVQYAPAQTTPVQSAQPYTMAPPQMRVEHQMNRGLAIAGGVLFGVSWGVNILGSSLGGLLVYSGRSPGGLTYDQMFGASFIPVIGPLIFAGIAFDRGGMEFFGGLGLVDAAAQAAGLTMLIIGILGEDVEVNASAENELYVLPYANGEGAGLTASGTF
jgi:hypothetical protein